MELKDKSIVALYQIGDDVFCSDANSTAYKFPLTNANIVEREAISNHPDTHVPAECAFNAPDLRRSAFLLTTACSWFQLPAENVACQSLNPIYSASVEKVLCPSSTL